MARITIPCKNCGTVFSTKFKRQQYCVACQILRDLNFGMGSRKCSACDTTFWPIRNTYRVCPKCIEASPGGTTQTIECSFCGEQGRAVPATDKTCLACISSSAKIRAQYREVLRFHVRKMKESNAK